MRLTIVTGFFLPVPPVQGGATEKIWFRLAKEFARRGHEVTFISRKWPSFPDTEVVDGVRFIRVTGMNHTRRLAINLVWDFIWGLRVFRKVPKADATICNAVALPAWLGIAKKSAGKVVAVVARMPKGQARFYGKVDLLLSLSEEVTARLVAENQTLAPKIRRFPFPIDWELHAHAARNRTFPRVVRIGYIGRLNPEKGIDVLIGALARLLQNSEIPEWTATLLGPVAIPSGGGGEAWLDSLINPLEPRLKQRLEILPPVFDPSALAQRYASIDIFVYPSLADRGETFGVAVAEAMAARCAAVVSGLACFNGLVSDEQTGFVFDHRAKDREERLALILGRLVAEPELRARIGRQGQEYSRQFDFDHVATQVLQDLGEAVFGGPSSPSPGN